MANWLDTAWTWTRSNVYTVLDDEADGLNDDLDANWNPMDSVNGVDH
jgi:hypothetical protein